MSICVLRGGGGRAVIFCFLLETWLGLITEAPFRQPNFLCVSVYIFFPVVSCFASEGRSSIGFVAFFLMIFSSTMLYYLKSYAKFAVMLTLV